MAPVLVRGAIAVDPSIDGRLAVGAEAAPQRQVVRTLENLNRVDLQGARALEVLDEGALRQSHGPSRRGQALAVQPEPPHGIERDSRGRAAGHECMITGELAKYRRESLGAGRRGRQV